MRRIVDIALSSILIVVTLPLWIIIIVAIMILSPGAPFFAHNRVGQFGRPFVLIKFRTMRSGSRNRLNLTVAGDDRVTSIGRILRRYKLDEIPQLINVLVGNMTFVGPRPEIPEFVDLYTEEQKEILQFKPGLTDPASLKYRDEEQQLAKFEDPVSGYITEVLPDKLRISLQYQQERNLPSDLNIIWATFIALLK